ncbi:glycosyltransferase family 4 protein [Pedobacter polysacchareus]|uniref:glycosyltransferase family 4 protein n=1 Tax=Pedobacter polysacchareus TaxID=2861973 RepID=UPI001C99C6DD|nr:glycosyltransferase family 4 protein [Pedobacter polysacchareus]
MNILFLTLVRITDVSERGIYTDLVRYFRDEGHNVCIACPSERRYNEKTSLKNSKGINILNIATLNIQKTNFIEKGIATVLLERQFLKAIKNYYSDVEFDLLVYSTPPITFSKIVSYFKQRCNARSYLLLKDIFPQNAVDLGFIKRSGLLHRYFSAKEKRLYQISDHIGCMSPANVEYIIKNNKYLEPSKVELNPNSLTPLVFDEYIEKKHLTRESYGIPQHSTVFIYGGNLGKPQGIDFLLTVLNSNVGNEQAFFVIVGSGTEFPLLLKWHEKFAPKNVLLLSGLEKSKYDVLLSSCDVGLIFLDRRFTIPNFPSRLLSYLEYKMPIVAATDRNTDIGKIAVTNHFGRWCESGDLESFNEIIRELSFNDELRTRMGINGYDFMMNNYLVKNSYEVIMKHFNNV